MRPGDGQIVDVHLAARLLELRQDIGCEAADDRLAARRGEGDEGVAAEQAPHVRRVGPRVAVRARVLEGLAEHREQRIHGREVVRSERAYPRLRCWHPALPLVVRPAVSPAKMRRARGPIAQWLEQRTHNPLVPGSSPGGPTK